MEFLEEEVEKEQQTYHSLIFGFLVWASKLLAVVLPLVFALSDLEQFYNNMMFVFGYTERPQFFSTDLFAPCAESIFFHGIMQVVSGVFSLSAVGIILLTQSFSKLWRRVFWIYLICLMLVGVSSGNLFWLFDISAFVSLLCS